MDRSAGKLDKLELSLGALSLWSEFHILAYNLYMVWCIAWGWSGNR